MSENTVSIQYHLAPDEKSAPVMAYTENSMVWGDVIVKEMIRVSTWLRTNTAPDHIHLVNAHCLLMNSTDPAKAILLKELHLPTQKINAFHLIPPAKEPLDYDANEPNRRMEPVTLLTGQFRLDGSLRLAGKVDLGKYIEAAHEAYISLYDVEVSYIGLPALGTMHTSFMLVRMASAIFASR